MKKIMFMVAGIATFMSVMTLKVQGAKMSNEADVCTKSLFVIGDKPTKIGDTVIVQYVFANNSDLDVGECEVYLDLAVQSTILRDPKSPVTISGLKAHETVKGQALFHIEKLGNYIGTGWIKIKEPHMKDSNPKNNELRVPLFEIKLNPVAPGMHK